MQHQESINVIRRLGPQLTKEAAESVLLRYAEEEDLSPAQLEKLAQTYNITRQLSHIEGSADRGSTCHQIDTPSLVATYSLGGAKSATVRTQTETHYADNVNLMQALCAEIRPPVVKAASISAPTITKAPKVSASETELRDAIWEAKVDVYHTADALFKMAHCEGRVLQLAQAEEDASRYCNRAAVVATLGWLEKYAAAQKISREISRHEGPVKEAAFNVSTDLSDQIVRLVEAMTVSSMLQKVASGVGVKLGDIWPSKEVVDQTAGVDAEAFVDSLVNDINAAKTTADPTDTEEATGAQTGTSETDNKGAEGQAGFRKPKIENEEVPKPTTKSPKEAKEPKGKPFKGESEGAGTPNRSPNWLASLVSGADRAAGAVANSAHATAMAMQNQVNSVTGKDRVNKNQMKLDADIQDIKRSILIRRLAATDPVLRDMPLKDVLDTYNAIAEMNPEVASNPRRVLLALREATSYEGTPLDTQKLLGDVRSTAAKSEKEEAENSKTRYNVRK